jgi:hypothetical protein
MLAFSNLARESTFNSSWMVLPVAGADAPRQPGLMRRESSAAEFLRRLRGDDCERNGWPAAQPQSDRSGSAFEPEPAAKPAIMCTVELCAEPLLLVGRIDLYAMGSENISPVFAVERRLDQE